MKSRPNVPGMVIHPMTLTIHRVVRLGLLLGWFSSIISCSRSYGGYGRLNWNEQRGFSGSGGGKIALSHPVGDHESSPSDPRGWTMDMGIAAGAGYGQSGFHGTLQSAMLPPKYQWIGESLGFEIGLVLNLDIDKDGMHGGPELQIGLLRKIDREPNILRHLSFDLAVGYEPSAGFQLGLICGYNVIDWGSDNSI